MSTMNLIAGILPVESQTRTHLAATPDLVYHAVSPVWATVWR